MSKHITLGYKLQQHKQVLLIDLLWKGQTCLKKSCCGTQYDCITLKAVEKRPIPSSFRIITSFKLHEGGHLIENSCKN